MDKHLYQLSRSTVITIYMSWFSDLAYRPITLQVTYPEHCQAFKMGHL